MIQEEVSFYSCGFKLWGNLRIPDDWKPGQRRAAVLQCPGLRQGGADPVRSPVDRKAETVVDSLVGRGYVVLSIHGRGFGRSEGPLGPAGSLRARFNPVEQVDDSRSAITYLQQRPEVDPESIGAFGGSFGGALTTYLAAVDRRVKCCAGTLGIGDGEAWLRGMRRGWEFHAFKKRVEEDLRRQVLGGQPEYVDLDEIMILGPESEETHRKVLESLGKKTLYSLDSARYIMDFRPAEVAAKIICPLIVVVLENDSLTPPEDFVKIYERARGPKKLVTIPGISRPELFRLENADKLAAPVAEWFCQWLPARKL